MQQADGLLEDLSRERADFWDGQLFVVDALLKDASNKLAHRVEVRLAAAAAMLERRYASEGEAVVSLLRTRSKSAPLATRTSSISPITSVWAWGGNRRGQLGDGTLASHLTPGQVTGISAPFIASIAAGGSCALVLGTDGRIWAWGDNSWAKQGDGSALPITGRVQVTGLASVTQVAAGWDFSLAVLAE